MLIFWASNYAFNPHFTSNLTLEMFVCKVKNIPYCGPYTMINKTATVTSRWHQLTTVLTFWSLRCACVFWSNKWPYLDKRVKCQLLAKSAKKQTSAI